MHLRRFRRQGRFLIAAVLLTTGLAIAVPAGASAAPITGAITDIEITETTVGQFDSFRVDIDWAVPNSANGGDTFTLDLPDELKAMTGGFNLLAPDGSVVAVATIDDQGLVTFTLTDYVNTHDDVKGTAFFEVQYTEETTSGEPITLEFDADGTVFTEELTGEGVPEIDRTKPGKIGYWADSATQAQNPDGALVWRLQGPEGPFDQVVFDDTLGTGQKIDCDSFFIRSSTTTKPSGELIDPQPVAADRYDEPQLVCTDNKLVLTVTGVGEGEIVEIGYTSTIVDPPQDVYSNHADVTADGIPQPTTSNVRKYTSGGDGSGSVPSTPTSSTTPPTPTSTTPLTPTSTSTPPTSTSTPPTTTSPPITPPTSPPTTITVESTTSTSPAPTTSEPTPTPTTRTITVVSTTKTIPTAINGGLPTSPEDSGLPIALIAGASLVLAAGGLTVAARRRR